MTGMDMAKATQGEWVRGEVPSLIGGVDTDSRDFIAGHAFLALRGHTFDGHRYAAQVADQASALIGDARGVEGWKALTQVPHLQVQDTLRALGDLAAWYRQTLTHCRVIAITGSYGKTTVRSMLEHVLRKLGVTVAATQENFNNLIGVPKTLMAVPDDTAVAIVECGISEPGEMERLSAMVRPDVAVVTGLGAAHAEGLGGLLGVAREKAMLFKHLSPQGWCVLGPGVKAVFQQASCVTPHECIAMDDRNSVHGELKGMRLTLCSRQDKAELMLPLPARHWAEDMALAAQVILRLGQDMGQAFGLHDIVQALQSWRPVAGRMQVIRFGTDITVLDDSYNANPASMQAALDTLAALDGYRIAILGDMLELGDDAADLHAGLALHDIDEVLAVGALMANLHTANPTRKIHAFRDATMLAPWLKGKDLPPCHSTILIKGSHGTGLYRIAEELQARAAMHQRGCHAV